MRPRHFLLAPRGLFAYDVCWGASVIWLWGFCTPAMLFLPETYAPNTCLETSYLSFKA